jgi:hypothetical integral membrane protein (TIGR02206 family)
MRHGARVRTLSRVLDLWPDKFAPFGILHGLVLVVSSIAWWVAVVWARSVAGTPRERAWRVAMAVFVWGFNVAWTARLLLPANFELGRSLPFQLCDLGWMAAGWSLWSGGDPQRLRHQVPVLWGLALSAFGYLTPAVTSGPGGIHFWTFWISHGQILTTAVVNLLAFGTRPDAKGLRGTLVLTTVACVLATAFNLRYGTSYFFTGRDIPSNPSPLDHLGAWPLRILWVMVAGAAALCLVALPFLRADTRGSASGDGRGAAGPGADPPA